MLELWSAIGLLFVLEGALYALFPRAMKRMTVQMAAMPTDRLRWIGLGLAIIGFLVVAAGHHASGQ